MRDLANKVAVVTGAASGIGFAMAERFAREGMKVVLADVEASALARAEADLLAQGATVLAVRTDVSRADDVDALAEKTVAAFGGVQLVCNNAGVALFKSCWEHTVADWEWVLGVNLWGVLHGVRAFVPLMLRQGTEGHIVNTASIAGLITSSFFGSSTSPSTASSPSPRIFRASSRRLAPRSGSPSCVPGSFGPRSCPARAIDRAPW